MNWMKWLAVFGVLMAFVGQAQAAHASVPIVNYENQLVTRADGKALSAEEVRKGILRAASVKHWMMSEKDGVLYGMLNIKDRHFMTVSIAYTANSYSVKYYGSENLGYVKQDSAKIGEGGIVVKEVQELIHPNYNLWVRQFVEEIARQLQN